MLEAESTLPRHRAALSLALAAFAAALSIAIGVTVGNPNTTLALVVCGVLGALLLGFVVVRPYYGFLVLAGSGILLAVVAVTPDRYMNAFDLLMPPMLVAWYFSREAREARSRSAVLEPGPVGEIARSSRNLTRAVLWFYAIAALSLVQMPFRIGSAAALDSTLGLIRGFEGLLVFPLAIWCIRTERNVRETCYALLVAGIVFIGVNTGQMLVLHTPRAGITWVMNHMDWPVEGANEAGATMVILFALILVYNSVRPRLTNFLLMGAVIFLLFLTLSRSGIVAMAVFFAFGLRRIRARHLLAGVGLIGVALAFVPWDFWWRMSRSIAFTRGSFEVYTVMIRVYGYLTSFRMFAHNWLTGLGWLGGRFVSQNYNELGLTKLGAENYFLETAVGTGIIGFTLMIFCFVRLYQLGGAVRRAAPPKSFAHEMASVHAPLVTALLAANLTADNFTGMISLSQIAVWCALLIRSGQLASHPSALGEGA